jgi:hypothetical protein
MKIHLLMTVTALAMGIASPAMAQSNTMLDMRSSSNILIPPSKRWLRTHRIDPPKQRSYSSRSAARWKAPFGSRQTGNGTEWSSSRSRTSSLIPSDKTALYGIY